MTPISSIRGWRHRWKLFSRGKVEIDYILKSADPAASISVKLEWLEQLIGWVRSIGEIPHEFDRGTGQLHSVRIRFFLHLLDRNPEWKTKVAATLRSLLIESSGVSLFSQTGVPQETGFSLEFFARILNKFLPTPPRRGDLSQVFSRIFDSTSDSLWVENISPELGGQLLSLLQYNDPGNAVEVLNSFAQDMSDALILLGTRVAHLGLTSEITDRLPQRRVIDSSFFKLMKCIEGNQDLTVLPQLLQECRNDIDSVYKHLEKSGVSLGLVYKLETLSISLDRIQNIALLLGKIVATPGENILFKFLSDLIYQNIQANSLGELTGSHIHFLAKKVVERAGDSGEHYIARDRREWFQMFLSAFGGGFITSFTTYFKFFIIRWEAPLFFEGFFYWINYSGSFLLMQFLGFTLATKQPSVTAPALAGKLKQIDRAQDVDDFVNEVILIMRSQFAAVVGNIGAVIPFCILITALYRNTLGYPVLTPEEAEHVIASLNPFTTLTILYGAITGVVLWASSIAGGWLENWFVFHEIPLSIEKNILLNRVFGAERCRNFVSGALKQISGLGVNISLGFFLAFTPVVGRFFGLPLEAKHVTLSTGALTFAMSSIHRADWDMKAIGFAWFGIVIIGLLNFGVSFLLALFVAQRARNIPIRLVKRLVAAVRTRFFKNPFAFLFAPVK